MKNSIYIFLACAAYVTITSGNLVHNPGSMLGLEEDATEFYEQRKLEEEPELNEDDNEIDPRLTQRYSESSIGPYECSTHIQCVNGGTCLTTAKGKLCNCSSEYLGPYCDYSASSIDKALRVHPLFKVSFAECMTKAGKTAGINALALLEKCGGGQNMCWLHEGGVKGLKCFFWCLTNGMRLSLTEAKPSEESRLSLYKEVFQKFSRERHLPETPKPSHRPKGIPIASLQINLYDTSNHDYPYPKHGTFGLPEISIKPSVSFWTPTYKQGTYPPKGQPYGSPYASEKGRDPPIYEPSPSDQNPFVYPKSHEIPTTEPNGDEMGPVDENGMNNFFWEMHSYGTEEDPAEQNKESDKEEPPLEGAPSDNFLNEAVHDVMLDIYDSNVVEASEEDNEIVDDSELMASPYDLPFPYHDEASNMREGPPNE